MDSLEWLEKFYKTEAGKRALREFLAAMPTKDTRESLLGITTQEKTND
jgi:hypothetical protein